jgi:DNA (cytosine-5)-methyltransferase 1
MGHDERSAQFTPNKTDPLTASDYKQPPIVGEPKIAGTLSATFYKGAGNNSVDACLWPDSKANTVRRLTPLECERLQGLPDGYTLINDSSCRDSARYKALGNGMAQPCADYIIRRIVEVSENE